MTDLTENDATAIAKAIHILTEAGFDVQQIDDGEPTEGGVVFDLKVRGRSRYDNFWGRVEAAERVLEETPDIDMAGNPVEGDE